MNGNKSMPQTPQTPLTPEERAIYEWQMWVPEVGEAGQQKLKNASVLISRLGGLGGVVAYELAAAGVGKLVLAHGGNVKPSDLNRQLLMTHDWIGKPRMESIVRRLHELNPRVEISALGENVNEQNAASLVSQADVVVDCAPLFQERLALNRESVKQKKPMVEAAMYDFDASLTTLKSPDTPCLSCLYPSPPPYWRREFPVFGAVSGAVACLAATEVIKLICGVGAPLAGKMLLMDLREMSFQTVKINRDPKCAVCGDSIV